MEDRTDHIQEATGWSLEGDFGKAKYHLNVALAGKSEDALLKIETKMVEAASGELQNEEQLRRGMTPGDTDPVILSRFYIGRAYLRYHAGRRGEAKSDLIEAISLDDKAALAHNSLGRHYVLFDKDLEKGRAHLESAKRLCPDAISPRVDLVNLEVENRDYRSAFQDARALVRRKPHSIKAWTTLVVASLAVAPWSGRSVTIAAATFMFVPYAGPIIFTACIGLSVVAFLALRRTHGAITLLPSIMFALLVPAFFLRWLLLRRVWP